MASGYRTMSSRGGMNHGYSGIGKEPVSGTLFDSRPVGQEKLDRIPEAGRIVPAACNDQPRRFYVPRSPETPAKPGVSRPFTIMRH